MNTDAGKVQGAATAARQLLNHTAVNRLELYRPYPFQKRFHDAKDMNGYPAMQRLLMAGNQVGKCVSFETLISHPDGTQSRAGDLYKAGKPFFVMAWDGRRLVAAIADGFIRKEPETIYRVNLESGDWFECAADHRVLLASGGYAFLRSLLVSVPCLPVSSSEHDRSIHGVGGLRWFETWRDWPDRCLGDSRRCGGLLLIAAGSGQFLAPLPTGVPLLGFSSFGSGDRASKCTDIRREARAHPSSQGADRPNVGHFAAFGAQVCERAVRWWWCVRRNVLRPSIVGVFAFLLNSAIRTRGYKQGARLFSPFMDGNRIISYSVVGVNDVYDFTVPEFHNYLAAGVIHHNTESGANEVAYHATGEYPDWWDGIRLEHPLKIWCGGQNNDKARDICQAKLLGKPDDPDDFGKGALPRASIIKTTRKPGIPDAFESALIRHKAGHTVTVAFKSYEAGKKDWMGEPVDVIWLDEEPDEYIYSQALARVISTGGLIYMTFTPENGATLVVTNFRDDPKPGQALVQAGWSDAAHLSKEVTDQLLQAMPEHERDMRSRGEPTLGSGVIFPVADENISCEPFPIPRHFQRINAIDFGGFDHPTAVVFIAYEQDTDVAYIYDIHKERKLLPVVHAEAIKARGSWIPTMWPHDGHQKDKGSFIGLAVQYEGFGVKMHPEHFTNPDGGIGIEPGLMSMLERMQTGRLKVFSHLAAWFQEKRSYHRKDGEIVKLNDDLMSASRYGLQMKNFAVTDVDSREALPTHAEGSGEDYDPYQGATP